MRHDGKWSWQFWSYEYILYNMSIPVVNVLMACVHNTSRWRKACTVENLRIFVFLSIIFSLRIPFIVRRVDNFFRCFCHCCSSLFLFWAPTIDCHQIRLCFWGSGIFSWHRKGEPLFTKSYLESFLRIISCSWIQPTNITLCSLPVDRRPHFRLAASEAAAASDWGEEKAGGC